MALQSVDPNNVNQNQPAQSPDDNLMLKPPQTPVPSANPMNTAELDANKIAKATLQGDQQIAASAGKGGSSGGMGGIFGAVGSILGDLFAQGGPVGMATGGEVANPNEDAMALGYLVGALHQRDYGGTPDTLQQAAGDIKNHMQMAEGNPSPANAVTAATNNMAIAGEKNPYTGVRTGMAPSVNTTNDLRRELQNKGFQGFASGGPTTSPFTDDSLAEKSLMQALGLDNPSQMQKPTVPDTQMPVQNPQINPQPQQTSDPNQQRGYAAGGPQMPPQGSPEQGSQPLQPGQPFNGDGAVRGPGGPTDDAIPAKLSNGEFVMSAPATAFFGVDKLTKMNDQGKQGFIQARGQVQADQQNPAASGPQMPPQATQPQPPMQMPPMPPPGGMARGGSVVKTKGSGYCGF